MKRYLFLCLAALALLLSCEKEPVEPVGSDITFQLSASHPGETKAVKTDWENGDVIFVFFNSPRVTAPNYLKMLYGNGTWTCTEMNGSTASPGCLGLVNGDEGTMNALFLPFGSGATVSADGTNYKFSGGPYYTYYLTAESPLHFKVENNTVSGTFQMYIPVGFVQFFVEDASANKQDKDYTLGVDAVIPVTVDYVAADGTVHELNYPDSEDPDTHVVTKGWAFDLPGYVYRNGYLFSGKLRSDYGFGGNYYFAKKKTSDNTRADYFVTGKTLTSRKGVKLPANNNTSWQQVGPSHSVVMQTGTSWFTCNSKDAQTRLIYPDKVKPLIYSNASSMSLPSETEFNNLIANSSQTWISIHGRYGMVFKSNSGSGFLFLPAPDNVRGYYWCAGSSKSSAPCLVITSSKAEVLPSTTHQQENAYVRLMSK